MKKSSAKPTSIQLENCYDYEAVCPHDSLHFQSVEEWKSHHLHQHMDTKWKCPLCGTLSSSWHNYSYHVQSWKHKAVCPPPWICKLQLKCTLCNKCLDQQNLFDCGRCCGARYGSKYQLIRHITTSHPSYKVEKILSHIPCAS